MQNHPAILGDLAGLPVLPHDVGGSQDLGSQVQVEWSHDHGGIEALEPIEPLSDGDDVLSVPVVGDLATCLLDVTDVFEITSEHWEYIASDPVSHVRVEESQSVDQLGGFDRGYFAKVQDLVFALAVNDQAVGVGFDTCHDRQEHLTTESPLDLLFKVTNVIASGFDVVTEPATAVPLSVVDLVLRWWWIGLRVVVCQESQTVKTIIEVVTPDPVADHLVKIWPPEVEPPADVAKRLKVSLG